MVIEDVVFKLRGIKSLLYYMSEVDEQVEDSDFGLMLLCEEMEDCIEKLNETMKKN